MLLSGLGLGDLDDAFSNWERWGKRIHRALAHSCCGHTQNLSFGIFLGIPLSGAQGLLMAVQWWVQTWVSCMQSVLSTLSFVQTIITPTSLLLVYFCFSYFVVMETQLRLPPTHTRGVLCLDLGPRLVMIMSYSWLCTWGTPPTACAQVLYSGVK